jgi:hypothetical protein
MPTPNTATARVAKHGDKMIEVRVRFWTDSISEHKDTILPKHAWDGGVVVMDTNRSHGIKPGPPRPFNSVLDLPSALAKVLVDHGIILHTSTKTRKLLQPRRAKT